ncbi:MAG TPA: efflux RND transporter periplasmic adaptor subunit [Syntrophorhabdaceae bacterium]|nr:efflux RND transporter periplasmic adaptor subunit [Syntrophorhabdaceae bacterium]
MADDLSKLKIDKSRQGFKTKRKRKPLYLLTALSLAALVLALVVSGVFSPAIQVEVATVGKAYPSQTFTLLNASGYVVPQRKSSVAAKVTGRLVALYVEEGSVIKKNQVIAQLENDDLTASRKQAVANLNVARAGYDQAKAELNDAQVSFERQKQLIAKELIAKSDYDTAEARFKKAVAGLTSADASIKAAEAALIGIDVSLSYTYVRAPFDAVVLTKNADVGDIVTPIGAAANAKSAVVTIADMNSLQVEADVSESNIERLKSGQPCEIQLDAIPDTRFAGTIHMIVPTADRSKATVMVKVGFNQPDGRILPEMSAKVAFLSREVKKEEEKSRTAVSSSAVVDRQGKKFLFVVKRDRAQLTPVSLGAPLGDMTEIASGVVSGEKVVLNPPKGLANHARIKIPER